MAINKKLISFATQAQFDAYLANNNIDPRSIVFIEDKKRIWTHGVFFDTSWDYVTGKPDTYTPSAHALGSHSDITLTTPDNGDILKYDGSKWVNNTLAQAGVATSTDITNAVSDIEIGGRNYLTNTNDGKTIFIKSNSASVGSYNKVVFNGTGGTPYGAMHPFYSNDFDPDKTLTFSLEYKASTTVGGRFQLQFRPGKYLDIPVSDTNGEWVKASATSSRNVDMATSYLYLYGIASNHAVNVVEYRNLKIEYGNKATDWTPAPEDVQAEIDLKANIASPTFTGVPLAPTAAVATNTTQIATTAFVKSQNYLTSITKAQVEGVLTGNISTHTHSYLPLTGGTLTGDITVPNFIAKNPLMNTGSAEMMFQHGGSSNPKTSIIAKASGAWGKSDLHIALSTTNDSIAATIADTKLVILNNGNVGIGTTSPAYKLDVSGDVRASGTFRGSLTGNASSATYASAVTLTADNTTNATRYPLFVDAATGNKSPRTDTGFTYNPSTRALTSTSFVGSLSGNANSASSIGGLSKENLAKEVHYGTTSSPAGYYKVKILPATSWMTSFTIRVYQGYNMYDITISGYNYAGNYWHLPKATLSNSSVKSIPISFGYDSAYNLWVAFPASSYAGITVINANNGYTQVADFGSKFTIIHETALTGTVQTTITANTNIPGNAATATKLGTATVGSTQLPIYLNAGTPTAITQANLRKGLFGTTAIGSTTQPIYIAANGVPTAITGSIANSTTGNAATATTATYLTRAGGSITTAPATYGLRFDSAVGSSTAGIFPVSDNSNAVITINRHSGNYDSQLGFSSNGNIYYRSFSNVALNTTQAWRTVWDSGNISPVTTNTTQTISAQKTFTNGLNVNVSTAGDGGWSKGIIVNSTSSTAGEATIAFTNNSTGANYWIAGINQSADFDIAYGTTFSNAVTKLRIDINGRVGLGGNITPAEILDVTGNIKSSGTVNANNFVSTATSGFMLTGAKATWANAIQAPTGGGLAFVTNGLSLTEGNSSLRLAPNGDIYLGRSSGSTLTFEGNATLNGSVLISDVVIINDALTTSRGLTVTQTASTGIGISLYGTAANSTNPQYGIMFATTASKGTHGSVTGTHATYFTMSNTTNRGWIFTTDAAGTTGNIASISNAGHMRLNGNLTAARAFKSSDRSLKTEVEKITEESIDNINFVKFRWKDSGKLDYGVIAQDVEPYYPELINLSGGKKFVNYDSLHSLKISRLETKIEMLQKRLSDMERRLNG